MHVLSFCLTNAYARMRVCRGSHKWGITCIYWSGRRCVRTGGEPIEWVWGGRIKEGYQAKAARPHFLVVKASSPYSVLLIETPRPRVKIEFAASIAPPALLHKQKQRRWWCSRPCMICMHACLVPFVSPLIIRANNQPRTMHAYACVTCTFSGCRIWRERYERWSSCTHQQFSSKASISERMVIFLVLSQLKTRGL
jgi:hypothetical protein